MTFTTIESDSECTNDSDDESEFTRIALHDMYNDVLNHATYTEDCATFFSATGCLESPSYMKKRDSFVTPERHSITSSIASSVTSSYMLSVAKTTDDDLSYITERTLMELSQSSKPSDNGDILKQSFGVDISPRIIEIRNRDMLRLKKVSDDCSDCRKKGLINIFGSDFVFNSSSTTLRFLDGSDNCAQSVLLNTSSYASFEGFVIAMTFQISAVLTMNIQLYLARVVNAIAS